MDAAAASIGRRSRPDKQHSADRGRAGVDRSGHCEGPQQGAGILVISVQTEAHINAEEPGKQDPVCHARRGGAVIMIVLPGDAAMVAEQIESVDARVLKESILRIGGVAHLWAFLALCRQWSTATLAHI